MFEFGLIRGLVFGIEYATPYDLEDTDIVWAIHISLGILGITICKL